MGTNHFFMKFTKTVEIPSESVSIFLKNLRDMNQDQVIQFISEYIAPGNVPTNPMRLLRALACKAELKFLWEPMQERLLKEICAKALPELKEGIHIGSDQYRPYPPKIKEALLRAFVTPEHRMSVISEVFESKEYERFCDSCITDRRPTYVNNQ
jgi:hypothetical protein